MSSQNPVKSVFLSGIEKLIVLLEERAGSQPEQGSWTPRGGGEIPSRRPSSELTLLIARLTQIRDWLQNDPLLVDLVDRYIGKQVQKQARKTFWLSILWTIVGAVLGWLLSSLGTPETIWRLFARM